MTDPMQPFELASALRSHDAEWFRQMHARLRWFSFCVPRPREAEGDGLAIAFRTDDGGVDELSALLGVGPTGAGLSTPQRGPFAGATLSCYPSRLVLDTSADPQPWPTLTVRLWNPRDVWSVDDELVGTATAVEGELDTLPLGRWPLERRLLAWLTPSRHPGLFLP